MKTKLHLQPLAFSLQPFLLALFFLLAAPPAPAQDLPPLAQIVSNVLQATRPTEAYNVTVNQTLSPPLTSATPAGLAPAAQARAAATEAPTVQTFDSTFEPTNRQWVAQRAHARTQKAKGAGPNATNQPPDQPGVRITVNLEPFLESLVSSNQVSVAREQLRGRACYRIDAKSGEDRVATLWVDAHRWHISKTVVYIMGQKFADVDCEYRQVNGRWLPAKAAIGHALDGSRADLEYGEYKRTGQK